MSVNIKSYLGNLRDKTKDKHDNDETSPTEKKGLVYKMDLIDDIMKVVNNSEVTLNQAEMAEEMINSIVKEGPVPEKKAPESKDGDAVDEFNPAILLITMFLNSCRA